MDSGSSTQYIALVIRSDRTALYSDGAKPGSERYKQRIMREHYVPSVLGKI